MTKKVIVCKEGMVCRASGTNAQHGGGATLPHVGATWQEIKPGSYAWVMDAPDDLPCEEHWGDEYPYPVLYIRLMDVTIEVISAGTKLDNDDIEDLSGECWWYSPSGNMVEEVVKNHKAIDDITLFLISFPASLGYANSLIDQFTFIQSEQEYTGAFIQPDDLAALAAAGKALLNRRNAGKKRPYRAVRFLMAYELTITEAGRIGDYYQEAECEATLTGWVKITPEGMTVVPIQELVEESKKPLPEDQESTIEQGDANQL